jgi:hypothetical protein
MLKRVISVSITYPMMLLWEIEGWCTSPLGQLFTLKAPQIYSTTVMTTSTLQKENRFFLNTR